MEKVVKIPEGGLSTPRYPISSVIIPKSSGSLFHVGLQQKERLPVGTVAFFQELCLFDDKTPHILQKFTANGVREVMEKFAITTEESGGQDRSANGDIFAPHRESVLDGPGGTAHRQAGIPEPILQVFGNGHHIGRQLIAVENEQIDV